MEDALTGLGFAISAWVVGQHREIPAWRALALALAWMALAQGIDAADDVSAWAEWPILGRRGWGHEAAEDVLGRLGGAILLVVWALRVGRRRGGSAVDDRGQRTTRLRPPRKE